MSDPILICLLRANMCERRSQPWEVTHQYTVLCRLANLAAAPQLYALIKYEPIVYMPHNIAVSCGTIP